MISSKKRQWLIGAMISGITLGTFLENTYAEEFDAMIRKELNFKGVINSIDVKF